MDLFLMIIFAGIITVVGSIALARNQKRALRSRGLLKASMIAVPSLSRHQSFIFEEGNFSFEVQKKKRFVHVTVRGEFAHAFEPFDVASQALPESLERALIDPHLRKAFQRLRARRDVQSMSSTLLQLEATFHYAVVNAGRLASILQSLVGFCDALSRTDLADKEKRKQLSAPSGAPVGVPPD